METLTHGRAASASRMAGCGVAAILVAGTPRPADAHAVLERSSPAAGAALARSPSAVVLEFNEDLEAAFSGIVVTDANGHAFASSPTTVNGSLLSESLVALRPGTYRVRWHAVSRDGHRTEGEFSFTVAR